jgi:hypothetical protein
MEKGDRCKENQFPEQMQTKSAEKGKGIAA